MNRLLPRLRRFASPVAWMLALALLLPAILMVLPSPATATERALWQDMQQSNCLAGMPSGRDGHVGQTMEQCCVLCAAPAVPLPADRLDEVATKLINRVPAGTAVAIEADVSRAALSAVIAPITGRGPPA